MGYSSDRIHLSWSRELVLLNDSPNLIGGIKLLKPFPLPWKINRDFPTKLEPYGSIVVQIDADMDEDHNALIKKFGEQMKPRLAVCLAPEVIANIVLELEFKNKCGRRIYQYSKFSGDGSVKNHK